MTADLPRCPDCDAPHDPRPCSRDNAMCGCCMRIYPSPEARAENCRRSQGVLDFGGVVLNPIAVEQRRQRRAEGERDTAPLDDTSKRNGSVFERIFAQRILAQHQLADILPGGVLCTCGAELAALNPPLDDSALKGDPLALAVHQLQEMEAAR